MNWGRLPSARRTSESRASRPGSVSETAWAGPAAEGTWSQARHSRGNDRAGSNRLSSPSAADASGSAAKKSAGIKVRCSVLISFLLREPLPVYLQPALEDRLQQKLHRAIDMDHVPLPVVEGT